MVKSLFNKWLSSSLSFNFIIFHLIMALFVIVLSIPVYLLADVVGWTTENSLLSLVLLWIYAAAPVSLETLILFLFTRFSRKRNFIDKSVFLILLLPFYIALLQGLYCLIQLEEAATSLLLLMIFSVLIISILAVGILIPLVVFIIIDVVKFLRQKV